MKRMKTFCSGLVAVACLCLNLPAVAQCDYQSLSPETKTYVTAPVAVLHAHVHTKMFFSCERAGNQYNLVLLLEAAVTELPANFHFSGPCALTITNEKSELLTLPVNTESYALTYHGVHKKDHPHIKEFHLRFHIDTTHQRKLREFADTHLATIELEGKGAGLLFPVKNHEGKRHDTPPLYLRTMLDCLTDEQLSNKD